MREIEYDPVSVAFHWLTALALVAMLVIGLTMVGLPKGAERSAWFALHKSLGISLALLVVFRLGWRLRSPQASATTLVRWAHRALYLLLLLVPVAGFLTSAFTAYPIAFWGLSLPRLFAENKELNEVWKLVHRGSLYVLMTLSLGHALAGLRHFAHGSRRMLPWRQPDRRELEGDVTNCGGMVGRDSAA